MITLGIIGIVAAMTLPTLVNNYKKQIYVVGLKKAYNNLLALDYQKLFSIYNQVLDDFATILDFYDNQIIIHPKNYLEANGITKIPPYMLWCIFK